jgi:adenylate kinase family enzyme
VSRRVHITGASGSGTTTLGKATAEHFGIPHFDSDDYFWVPTDPPYSEIRPRNERLSMLEPRLDATESWVLSGSNHSWGDPLIPRYTLVVFLYVPTEIRLARLRAREALEYGAALLPGGKMHEQAVEFLVWASEYDDGPATMRSLTAHEQWLATLRCPVLRLEGERTVADNLEALLASLATIR